MMKSLFKKKVTCKFCLKSVDKSTAFVIKYKSIDGIGNIDMCNECANDMNEIIDIRDTLYEED